MFISNSTRLVFAGMILSLIVLGRTASAVDFHFTVTADPRDYHDIFGATLQAINDEVGGPGQFHVSAGDFDHTVPENRAEIDAAFGPSAVWYPIVGNHELPSSTDDDIVWLRTEYNTGQDGRTALKYETNQDGPPGSVETTYSWDYGNAHFVALNEYWDGGTVPEVSDYGTDGDVVPELYAWLENDLANNDKPFVFVFGHEPAFPSYRHLTSSLNKYPTNRDAFWDLMESRGVNAYITGHSHLYTKFQRLGGDLWQIDTGNAGNESESSPDGQTFLNVVVSDTEVQYEVYRNNGTAEFSLHESWTQPAAPEPPTGTTVSFQQGVNGYTGTVDTFLSEDLPDADNSIAEELGVDADEPSDSSKVTQVLLRFEDIFGEAADQIPTGEDVAINWARLDLWTTNVGNGAELHRMIRAWNDTDTWNLLGAGVQADDVEALTLMDTLAGENGDVPMAGYGFDVTASLQAWLEDPDSNRGWVLLPFGDDGWDFYSSEGISEEGIVAPQLTVNFEIVPEPGALVLLAAGTAVLLPLSRRRRKRFGP